MQQLLYAPRGPHHRRSGHRDGAGARQRARAREAADRPDLVGRRSTRRSTRTTCASASRPPSRRRSRASRSRSRRAARDRRRAGHRSHGSAAREPRKDDRQAAAGEVGARRPAGDRDARQRSASPEEDRGRARAATEGRRSARRVQAAPTAAGFEAAIRCATSAGCSGFPARSSPALVDAGFVDAGARPPARIPVQLPGLVVLRAAQGLREARDPAGAHPALAAQAPRAACPTRCRSRGCGSRRSATRSS